MDDKPKIKVGDRVKFKDPHPYKLGRAEVLSGTVVDVKTQDTIEVEIDNYTDGHHGSSSNKCLTNRWYFRDIRDLALDANTHPVKAETSLLLPTDSAERKNIPLMGGLWHYFPSALIAVARISKKGNDKHNPGQPLHWSRDKSTDHLECIARHLLDYDKIDEDGEYHIDHLIWRACALSQLMKEANGAPKAPGAR